MASLQVRVQPPRHKTIKEQKRDEHHDSHHEYHGEKDSKNREVGHHDTNHNGTHPDHHSHHSGNHVSNPNVVHHHAVHHSEANSHKIEHDKKTASIKKSAPKSLQNPHATPGPKPGSKPVVTPIPHPAQPKPGPVIKSTAPNPGATNPPASSASIQKQIDQGKSSSSSNNQAGYNKAHNITTGGNVYTPTVSDYSKPWHQRPSTSGGNWLTNIGNSIASWLPQPTTENVSNNGAPSWWPSWLGGGQ